MSSLLLKGGRLIDPVNGRDETADLLLADGKVAAIGDDVIGQAQSGILEVDAAGKVVCPGLIDIHVHFREPGQGAKETIRTGAAAAAKGGFTTVVCMPNTSPAIDNPGTVALIQDSAERSANVNVLTTGAITRGIHGEELAPIGSLKNAGVVAITDDGHCVQDNDLMRRAMEYATMFGLPVMDHCQDYSLVGTGVMHEGYWNKTLGLPGWPSVGEEMIVARNILLAEKTGTHVHCQHMSAVGSVRLLREAKSRGVPISGEACPHHFTLTDSTIAGSDKFWSEDGHGVFWASNDHKPTWPEYDTNFKMNPPLRSAADREAVIDGVADGTLEIISSDHAPHCDYEKEVEFANAPFGITGLENELAVSLMQLYHSGRMKLSDLIERLTIAPARLIKLDRGTLSIGAVADVTVFDPDAEWIFNREETASKAFNNPFYGWKLKGRNFMTIVAGEIAWQ
ncbi:MAG: dihydroorotase [Verrucomicrobiota bacterium]|nr:dihydroorotase [Verrucomicrobiota bacterium]